MLSYARQGHYGIQLRMNRDSRHKGPVNFSFATVICLACVVSVAQPADAVPIAQWITQWVVTLDPGNNVVGNAAIARLFGVSSTANGEVNNTGFVFEPLRWTPIVRQP